MKRNPSIRPGRLEKVLAALLLLAMLLGFTAPASAVPRIVVDDASWGFPEFLAGANHGTGTKVWNFGDVYMNALPTALNGLTVYSNLGTSDPATGLTFPAGVRAYATPSLTWGETDQQPARNALTRGGIYGESNPIAIKLAATAGKTYRVELLAVDMLAVGGRSMSVSVEGQIVSADWYIPVGYPFNKVLAFETLADGDGLDLVIAGGPRNGADHTPAISALAVSEVWTGGRETALVPFGARWKYLDDGSDQGTWWRALEFDDGAWASGPAQLGYGDDDEATAINGWRAGTRIMTTYFRHSFVVTNRAALTNLAVRLLRDDGAIVHLNGTEVFRGNMPKDPIHYLTRAAVSIGLPEETTFYSGPVPPGSLHQGTNVVAVEVHQADPTSSDVSFDLELLANTPLGNFPPVVRFLSPTNSAVYSLGQSIPITVESVDSDGVIRQIEVSAGTNLLGFGMSSRLALDFSAPSPGVYQLTAQAGDDAGGWGVAEPVTIAVIQPDREAVMFGGFPSPSGLLLLGSAATSDGVLNLNPVDGGMGGAFLGRQVYLQAGFQAYFQYQITDVRNGGADGFAFVIQGLPLPRLGWGGGGMGYGGITNSLAIEFDTWGNPELADPSNNHISIQTGGVGENSSHHDDSLGHTDALPRLSDGKAHMVIVDYAPGLLRIFFDDTNNTPVLSANVNLETLLNLDFGRAWVGLTASTGFSTQLHKILNWATISYPTPVSVRLASPQPNTFLSFPSEVFILAEAASKNGAIASVEFFADGTSLETVRQAPYIINWRPTAAGRYTLTALARDRSDNQMRSDPVTVFLQTPGDPLVLVPRGSVWRYLDTGADQGTAWRDPSFDDSSWPAGPAQLGFGDGDEVTTVFGGPDNNRNPTIYFRHRFSVANPSPLNHLEVRLLRDDGGVVYLNGTEVFRSNMPQGDIAYLTYATNGATPSDKTTSFYTKVFSPDLLQPGENVLAVEIHQYDAASAGLSFDLELVARQVEPRIERILFRTDRRVQLNFQSVAGRQYTIQSSQDLIHWQAAASSLYGTGGIRSWASGVVPPEETIRFYRVVLQP